MYEGMMNIDFMIMDMEARLEKLESRPHSLFNLAEIEKLTKDIAKKKARAEILRTWPSRIEYGSNPTERQLIGFELETEVLGLLQPSYPTIRMSPPNTRGLDLIGDDIHVEVKAQHCKTGATTISHLYHSSKEWSIDHNIPEVAVRLVVSLKGFTLEAIRRANDLNVKFCTADDLRQGL